MSKKIQFRDRTAKALVDTSETCPAVSPDAVAASIGAEPVGAALGDAIGTVTPLALHDEIRHRLRSTGGRPALVGTTKRAKIPVNDLEWSKLEALADELATSTSKPSAGQVASVVLSAAIDKLCESIANKGNKSRILRDVAARTKPLAQQ